MQCRNEEIISRIFGAKSHDFEVHPNGPQQLELRSDEIAMIERTVSSNFNKKQREREREGGGSYCKEDCKFREQTRRENVSRFPEEGQPGRAVLSPRIFHFSYLPLRNEHNVLPFNSVFAFTKLQPTSRKIDLQ